MIIEWLFQASAQCMAFSAPSGGHCMHCSTKVTTIAWRHVISVSCVWPWRPYALAPCSSCSQFVLTLYLYCTLAIWIARHDDMWWPLVHNMKVQSEQQPLVSEVITLMRCKLSINTRKMQRPRWRTKRWLRIDMTHGGHQDVVKERTSLGRCLQ